MAMQQKPEDGGDEAGKKFYVNVEGTECEWGDDTITTNQIRELGGLPADQPVVEESPDGGERTLSEDEVIQLQPGHRYGRAAKYKRG
jgi:Multiubiquitin